MPLARDMSGAIDGASSLRERRREALISDARGAALDLMAVQGYSATSMSDISRRIGVSERTLFRHVESKDGLLASVTADWSRVIDAAMDAAPEDETFFDAYDRAMVELAESIAQDPRGSVVVLRLIDEDEGLRGRIWGWYGRQSETGIERHMRARMDADLSDERVRLVRAFLVTAVIEAQLAWVASGMETPLLDKLRANLALLRPLEQLIHNSTKQ